MLAFVIYLVYLCKEQWFSAIEALLFNATKLCGQQI